jgi:hypothetical protein
MQSPVYGPQQQSTYSGPYAPGVSPPTPGWGQKGADVLGSILDSITSNIGAATVSGNNFMKKLDSNLKPIVNEVSRAASMAANVSSMVDAFKGRDTSRLTQTLQNVEAAGKGKTTVESAKQLINSSSSPIASSKRRPKSYLADLEKEKKKKKKKKKKKTTSSFRLRR